MADAINGAAKYGDEAAELSDAARKFVDKSVKAQTNLAEKAANAQIDFVDNAVASKNRYIDKVTNSMNDVVDNSSVRKAVGDGVGDYTYKNIVGTNYDKIKPSQDWINMNEVKRYVQRLKAGEKLPPIEVYEVPGKGRFILDGHHRFVSSQITGIPADIKVLPSTGPVGLPDWANVMPN